MGLIFNDAYCYMCHKAIKNYKEGYRVHLRNIITNKVGECYVCSESCLLDLGNTLPKGYQLTYWEPKKK